MTNQEKKMIQYFEKELSFLSDCDPNQYDDLEVLHKDVLAAANCSISISQIKSLVDHIAHVIRCVSLPCEKFNIPVIHRLYIC